MHMLLVLFADHSNRNHPFILRVKTEVHLLTQASHRFISDCEGNKTGPVAYTFLCEF